MTRHIVITGATRGLGEALTKWFAARDHTVSGCGRSKDLVETMTARHASPHLFSVLDVTAADAVADWAAHVVEANGPPDLLINNAAIINRNAPLWEVPAAEFSQLVDINIKGVFNVTRAFLPAMLKAGHGIVVNLSSGWGRSTSPDVAPYCTSKWAIEGMTRALAQELPGGLAAIPLNPGVIDTDMLRSCFGEGAASSPSPEEWAARAAPFLLGLSPKDNGKPLTVP